MPIDVMEAEAAVEAKRMEPYYGFDPDAEYVIRAANRNYNGTSYEFYHFGAGECIAGAMREDATEEQKWARGERLVWFKDHRGFHVYERGTEPSRRDEPFWSHLEPDTAEDVGEMRAQTSWRPVEPTESKNQWQPFRAPDDTGEERASKRKARSSD